MQKVKIEIINKNSIIHTKPKITIAKFANQHPSYDIKMTTKDVRKAKTTPKIEIIILRIVYKEKIIIVANKKEKLAIKNLLNLVKYNFSKELEK
ncbi:phosphocarrier protein HPr [Borreliella chilensis]|uniref:Phosphocarrier protein HPr n=1 Tax=Borreliella chilensis TaxID=1245910 RepID=A0A0A7UVY2_9SPIR|nr:phosphocarrier protein HPr [Borreliella chilensis]